jgi:hypothetical protein
MSEPPRSPTYMWKLFLYAVDGATVLGVGTFPKHSTIYFYRGRELDDGSGLLQGTGKESRFVTLRSPADAKLPALKVGADGVQARRRCQAEFAEE